MVNNQTFVNKILTGKLSEISGNLWAGLEVWIPFGYQNATGFHYGIEFISSLLELSSETEVYPLLPWMKLPEIN